MEENVLRQSPLMQRISGQKQRILANLLNVKHKIAVVSGKGGVGKTFVSIHWAVSLAKKGFKVGLLDADIDCPNVHVFFGIHDSLEEVGGKIRPIEKNGVKIVSMAGFAESGKESQPRIWRGPLIGKAIADFLALSEWGKLDFLICDMPPGTSDAALTLMQFLDLDGVIVVGTSSPAAVLDAKKAVLMAKEMNQPVLGMIENMSGEIFGKGKIEKAALELNVPFLGSIPLQKNGFSLNNENSEELQAVLDSLEKRSK